MDNVVEIDDYRPHMHVTDPVTGNVIVFPLSLLFDLANGEAELMGGDEPEQMLRGLLAGLINLLEEVGDI